MGGYQEMLLTSSCILKVYMSLPCRVLIMPCVWLSILLILKWDVHASFLAFLVPVFDYLHVESFSRGFESLQWQDPSVETWTSHANSVWVAKRSGGRISYSGHSGVLALCSVVCRWIRNDDDLDRWWIRNCKVKSPTAIWWCHKAVDVVVNCMILDDIDICAMHQKDDHVPGDE